VLLAVGFDSLLSLLASSVGLLYYVGPVFDLCVMLRIPSFFRFKSGDEVEIHEPVSLLALHFYDYKSNDGRESQVVR
jgi:hypothetical protein